MRAVAVTVSGTAVTFGTPLTVETATLGDFTYTDFAADRFKPNLYPIDGSRALFTFTTGSSSTIIRHVVLSNSGGVLTSGSILYGLFGGSQGGNFPQAPSGFLAFSIADNEMAVMGVTINGTALAVTGTFGRGDVSLSTFVSYRFGLSGGVCGALQSSATTTANRLNQFSLFRFRANAAPQYIGALTLNDWLVTVNKVPVEISPNKAAFITGTALSQPSASVTSTVRLLIVEFPA